MSYDPQCQRIFICLPYWLEILQLLKFHLKLNFMKICNNPYLTMRPDEHKQKKNALYKKKHGIKTDSSTDAQKRETPKGGKVTKGAEGAGGVVGLKPNLSEQGRSFDDRRDGHAKDGAGNSLGDKNSSIDESIVRYNL